MLKLLVVSSEEQQEELLAKNIMASAFVDWAQYFPATFEQVYDAIFYLSMDDETNLPQSDALVFLNHLAFTCDQLPANYIRVNAWPGFINNNLFELAAPAALKEIAGAIMDKLAWNYVWAPDEPGLISGKIISMIINEAYYALQEKVSTKDEIDLAIKLGTNYPYGPFEWSRKIGLKNIYEVLDALGKKDDRYTICEMLKQEAIAVNP